MKHPPGAVLALDLSAETGSMALLAPSGDLLEVRRWEEERRGNPALWDALSCMLKRLPSGIGDVSCLAVGRGPGRYSGLRTALTLARALSLPTGVPVHAVDSGQALAFEIFSETNPPPSRVAVAGDARRGQCWIGFFRPAGPRPVPENPWRLVPLNSAVLFLPSDTVGVSAEWTRLAQLAGNPARGPWIRENRPPDAVSIGRLALLDRAAGHASGPLSPLYLHPAVSTAC